MKTVWAMLLLGLAAGAAFGQAPAVPGVAAADSGAATAAAPAKSIWSFLGLSHDNLARCREKFCKSGLGTLSRSMTTPVKMMTGGGLLPECCPQVPTAAEIARLSQPGAASPAEAFAAKIKADEANARERRLAVRYLGTVDCHYFPEAEAGIIAALRADRNECVRIEAALALANGCCCTKNSIEALNLVVSASEKDGNPAETSERVKCIAYQALNRCMSQPMLNFMPARQPPTLEPPILPPPTELPPVSAVVTPASFQFVAGNFNAPGGSVGDQARRTYAERIGAANPQRATPTGKRNLFQLLVQARNPPQAASEPPMPAPRSVPLTPIGQIPNQLPEPLQPR